ncbi:MAG: site-specific integrase [Erysipelotrichia bacterium]|jgi:integrase|nr:site-specific integrase [Erysipelotrichia bacterium]
MIILKVVQPIRDKKKIEDMKKILKAGSLRDYCLFVMGINSGLRISDLLALKISDVAENMKIKDRISLREKKTGKILDFPIGASSAKAIKEYLDTRDYNTDEYLFVSRKGHKPISNVQAWRILSGAAESVGITEPIGTHSLRKTFGYWAFKGGADITRIQKLLNHSSPGITLAYIGITRDELDDVYLNLNL